MIRRGICRYKKCIKYGFFSCASCGNAYSNLEPNIIYRLILYLEKKYFNYDKFITIENKKIKKFNRIMFIVYFCLSLSTGVFISLSILFILSLI